MNKSNSPSSIGQSRDALRGATTGRVRPFVDYSLRTKLIVAFLTVTFIPLGLLSFVNFRTTADTTTSRVGASLKSLADSQSLAVGDFVARQADKMQGLSLNQILRSGVETINAGYQGEAAQIQAQIQQLDQHWSTASEADPLIQSCLNSSMADELRRYRETFSDNLEVVVTDKYGALAAATSRTPNYYLGNTSWWKAAENNGRGSIHIDIGYAAFDQFKAVYGVVIAVPIYSNNQLVGILRTTYRVKGLTDLLASGQLGKTGGAVLLLPDGRTVSASGLESALLSPDLLAQLKAVETAEYAQTTFHGVPSLISQARVTEISERSPTASAKTISNLGWTIIVHQGQDESLEPVRRQTLNTLLLALLTVGGVIVVAFIMAQLLANPITRLTSVAQRITAGDLAAQAIAESRDEIGTLAHVFNSMTQQLHSLISGLEQRVAERTTELAQRGEELEKLNQTLQAASQSTERRAVQLAARGQVTRAASQIRDLDQLLPEVTRLISQAFGYYHVGIFMVDEAGRYAVLRAANSEGGQRMLARNHKLAVGTEGIVGNVVGTGQPRVVLDVGADAAHFDNPDLPETRSEIALPLQASGQTFGALDVQSTQAAAFADEDVAIMGMLADQVAIAIDNARLFAQTQSALQEAEETQRRYLRQEWERLMPALQATSHEYHASGVPPVGNAALPEIEQAIRQSDVVKIASQAAARSALAVPIKLRDQLIGVIDLHETEAEREWTAEDVALVMAVADQAALALENARLLEQTEQRARREQLVTQIATKVRVAADVEGILRTGVQEIRRVLGASHGIIHLTTGSQLPLKGKQEAD